MRVRRPACFLLILLSLPTAMGAQQGAPAPPQRDPQAVAVVQNALAAMGGASVIAQVQTAIASGSIAPAAGSDVRAGNFVWEDQITAQGHEFRNAFQSNGTSQLFVSGHGNPGWVLQGHVRKFTPHVANAALPIHLPAVLLATELANTNYSIRFVGPSTLNGQPAIQLHFTNDADIVQKTLSVQDWYFDPNTGLPLRVEYRVPDTSDPLQFIRAAVEYANFRVVQGLAVPFQILGYEQGIWRSIVTVSSVLLNPSLAATDFDLPPGGSP